MRHACTDASKGADIMLVLAVRVLDSVVSGGMGDVYAVTIDVSATNGCARTKVCTSTRFFATSWSTLAMVA